MSGSSEDSRTSALSRIPVGASALLGAAAVGIGFILLGSTREKSPSFPAPGHPVLEEALFEERPDPSPAPEFAFEFDPESEIFDDGFVPPPGPPPGPPHPPLRGPAAWWAITAAEQAAIERWDESFEKELGIEDLHRWLDANALKFPNIDVALLRAKLNKNF